MRNTTEAEKEVMIYLNELRESGDTNMYGATPYLMETFDINQTEAKRILILWMENFSEDGNYRQVKSD